jgi:hypothetical protein
MKALSVILDDIHELFDTNLINRILEYTVDFERRRADRAVANRELLNHILFIAACID